MYADEVTIAQAFEDQARRTPEAIALSEGTHTLSYRDLDRGWLGVQHGFRSRSGSRNYDFDDYERGSDLQV